MHSPAYYSTKEISFLVQHHLQMARLAVSCLMITQTGKSGGNGAGGALVIRTCQGMAVAKNENLGIFWPDILCMGNAIGSKKNTLKIVFD